MTTAPKPQWWREFDLRYWQMREALGYAVPARIDRRFPRQLGGNGGTNPFQCGLCEARRLHPGLHVASDIHRMDELSADKRDDFKHRVSIALAETGHFPSSTQTQDET